MEITNLTITDAILNGANAEFIEKNFKNLNVTGQDLINELNKMLEDENVTEEEFEIYCDNLDNIYTLKF